jgi:energy-coupling factor transporter transmembrane protein EcfT
MDDGSTSRLAPTAAIAGIAAHVLTVFLYLASGLLAPLAGVLFLLAGWVVLLVAGIRLRRPRPWLAALTPVASIGFWAAVLTFGDWVLGWTA